MTRPRRRKDLQAIHQALIYTLPAPPIPALAYLYYAPFAPPVPENVNALEERRWWECAQALSLEQIIGHRLVPANLLARVDCATQAFLEPGISENKAMIWLAPDRDAAVLITWYVEARLWGSTSYSTRDGKEGSTFARTREPLIAQALAEHLLPRPDIAVEPTRQMFGLDTVNPVFLACRETPLGKCLLVHAIQGISERTPRFALPAQAPEWLVSIVYEQRQMALLFSHTDMPSLDVVISYLFVLRQQLAFCQNAQDWPRLWGEEQSPYEVCQRDVNTFEDVLGEEILAVERAFLMTLRQEAVLAHPHGKEDKSV